VHQKAWGNLSTGLNIKISILSKLDLEGINVCIFDDSLGGLSNVFICPTLFDALRSSTGCTELFQPLWKLEALPTPMMNL
jgi:hypothetical protein